TRLQGDWSSDVCSSDLPRIAPRLRAVRLRRKNFRRSNFIVTSQELRAVKVSYLSFSPMRRRPIRPWRSQDLAEEPARALVAALGEGFRWRPVLDHNTAVGKINLIGDFAGKAHLMRDDDAGHAFFGELADGVQNFLDAFRIK